MFKPNINADWPTCNVGEFRHLITLLEQTVTTDAGGAVVTFEAGIPPTQAFAKIEYVRGVELIKAGLDVTQSYLKLTMWYRPEFKATQRIETPSGSQYIIQNVENIKEMNAYMVLFCLGVGANN